MSGKARKTFCVVSCGQVTDCWFVSSPCFGVDCVGPGPTVQVLCADVENHPNSPNDIIFKWNGFCYIINVNNATVDTLIHPVALLDDAEYDSCNSGGLECCVDFDCPSTTDCPTVLQVTTDITLRNNDNVFHCTMFPGEAESFGCNITCTRSGAFPVWEADKCNINGGGGLPICPDGTCYVNGADLDSDLSSFPRVGCTTLGNAIPPSWVCTITAGCIGVFNNFWVIKLNDLTFDAQGNVLNCPIGPGNVIIDENPANVLTLEAVSVVVT